MANDTILLLGSYNGQDSLGDECLLKSVIDQYRRAVRGRDIEFVLHAHARTPLLQSLESQGSFTSNWGIQSAFWRFRTQMRHTRLRPPLQTAAAAAIFPAYLGAAAAVDFMDTRTALAQIARARLLHIFGGTNFSFQWFTLNAPYYFATSALLRARGRPTYLGPQQYGPMSDAQLRVFRLWIDSGVRDYRARNPRCVELLGGDPQTHLISDEVYSNRSLYPIASQRPRDARYVLINVRGGSMSDDEGFTAQELDSFAEMLVGVHASIGLPYRFFAVSGLGLSEDTRSFDLLAARLAGRVPIESAGRVADEHELMALAAQAYGCISMSFHGCILSSFRGIPAVPITAGRYYDYKYIGFDQYGDGRPVPIVSLAEAASDENVAAVVDYLRGFDASAAARRRERAAEKIEAYYQAIVDREL